MPTLFIKFPVTGENVATGINLPKTFKENNINITNPSLGCPSCGQTHQWSTDEAFFLEE